MRPHVISEARRNAARRNGSKSRGPVTAAGKQNSSRNSIRHGILASTVVLPNEDRQGFDDLLACLLAEHRPQDETEYDLIETMVAARWRRARTRLFLNTALQMETNRVSDVECNIRTTQAGRSTLAFANLAGPDRQLELLRRYEVSLDRDYIRAYNTLQKKRVIAKRTREVQQKKDPRLAHPEQPETQQPQPLPACVEHDVA